MTTTAAESLNRPSVSELDDILGRPFSVLDDGFVRVVDYMGNDQAIVQAARVSYGAGTKKVNEDRGLIRYLMRHQHTTPFEMCELKLHVRVPMDCWRQWIRHRSASVNEYSTRYSLAIDATQQTSAAQWRLQAKSNRQGSAGSLSHSKGATLSQEEMSFHKHALDVYRHRIELGVAREQARKDLPLSTYTEAYWKIDLHNLFHFLALRMDSHAQLEIRSYANVIGNEIVKRWCPHAWEAFIDYRLERTTLSKLERAIVRCVGSHDVEEAMRLAKDFGWLEHGEKGLRRNHERAECEAKLKAFNLVVPWHPIEAV